MAPSFRPPLKPHSRDERRFLTPLRQFEAKFKALRGIEWAAKGDPKGEANKGALRLDFDRRLMHGLRGPVITSDAGLLAYRELDDVLALTITSGERLADAL
jgi:hypothetical protein